jgi:hypothetical protein
MSKKSIFICDWCKKEFEEWTYRQPRFCSSQCRSEFGCRQPKPNSHRQSRGGIVGWNCKQCGKEKTTFKSRVRDTCSQKCGKLYTSKATFIELNCGWCNKIFYLPNQKQNTDKNKKRFCSAKCADMHHGKKISGENNRWWKGGIAIKSRGDNWQSRSREVRKRDNYTCQNCGKHAVSVHHIKPYRLFNDDWQSANVLSNLITLCVSCHTRIEHSKIPCPIPKS